jgi:hypothetical protein
MRSLAHPSLKTARAKEHLDNLQELLEKFRDDYPVKLTREDDLSNQRHVLRLKVEDIPDKFALIVGDFRYCLRSSLDQHVWALAKLSISYPEGTQFPIFETPDKTRFDRYTKGVPTKAKDIIESLQPYHAQTGTVRSHLLWQLNKLCNIDKHRRIPTHSDISTVHFPDFPRKHGSLIDFDNEARVISVPIHLKDKMRVDSTGSLDVIFGDSHEGIQCNFEGLQAIYEFVTNGVLPRFMSFF